jgi:hypothetical protein
MYGPPEVGFDNLATFHCLPVDGSLRISVKPVMADSPVDLSGFTLKDSAD